MAEGGGLVKRLWALQHRRLALWAPVMIGLGVWSRFEVAWTHAPVFVGAVSCCSFVASFVLWRRGAVLGAIVCIAVLLASIGHWAGSIRIAFVDAPRLEESFRGVVSGRVVHADRSRSNAPRVTLDELTLVGVHRSAVPLRVRLTLVDVTDAPAIGSLITIDAVIGAPAGPAAPGAFDFSRQAYFRQIGGIGYVRGTVKVEQVSTSQDWRIRLARFRARLAQALRQRIGGEEGAVAAALIVGDRSEISDDATDALRDSGLAHLLAISGLHVGLMSALTFWLIRFLLALMPVFASRVAIRKIAAIGGLMAAGCYLALAGFGVATQRAFIMAAVAFTAILLDRPAVTARGLAVAACVILLVRPESLFEAGFQMSFAAVAALVAGYEVTRPYWRRRAQYTGWVSKFTTGLIATSATSVIAGAATAPFAAYHFNRLVAYGLPANLLATPVMGLWIMPMVILSAVLAPFGFAWVGLFLLGTGIGYILWVADWVAGLEGAVWSVQAGTTLALALIVFGGLWLVIWRGWIRSGSIGLIAAGIFLWAQAELPDVLISENAQLIAGKSQRQELWVSREKKSGYSAETWLRRAGQGDVSQQEAYERRQWSCTKYQCTGVVDGETKLTLIRGQSRRHLKDACDIGAIVVAPQLFRSSGAKQDCTLIDRSILDRASSVAITLRAGSRPLIEIAEPTRLGEGQ